MAINITNTWNKVVRLDWTHDPDMSTYYIVKKDGIRIGKTTANRYYAHYLDEGTTYTFEVVKVNSMEVETSVGTNTATTTTGVNYNGAEPRIIDARTVSPGYNPTNATTCYINAINSADEGDIVNFAPGASGDGKWRIGNTLGNQFQGGITSNYITINIEDGTEFNAINGTWTSNLSMFMRFDCLRGIRVIGYNALVYLRSSNFTSGDARMSIAFYNSAEWTVEGIELDGSGGDAIFWGDKYLGNEASVCAGFNVANERTLVYNVKASNHRRVGFGPTSMDGGQINHTHADLTGAIYEQANLFGYSFENDYPGQRLANIHLRYGYSTAALYSGIGFNITKATSATPNLSASFYDFVTDNNWLEDPATDVGNYRHRRDFHSSYGGGQGLIKFERTAFMNSRHAGFGATTYPNRIAFDLDDIALINPVNDASNSTNEFHAIDFNRLTIGNNLDLGNFDINGLFIEQSRNQAWLSFRGSSANTYELDDVGISNAMIVTPYTGGYYNPQNTPEGSNFNVAFTQQATAPTQTVSISSTADAERGGKYGNITVTRSVAAPYPTPVEIIFTGTAEAFDDYDFLPPVMVIPAGETSLTWPVKARFKNKENEVLIATIQPNDYYAIGTSSTNVNIINNKPTLVLDQLKAFPTAFGEGADVITGGRGGIKFFITTLSTSNIQTFVPANGGNDAYYTGSFSGAFLLNQTRHIIPRVSGNINGLNLSVNGQDNFSYHGHLAPEGGLKLINSTVQIQNTDNVIIRYLTVRDGASADPNSDALFIGTGNNIIIDHCSIAWGGDENFSFWTGRTGQNVYSNFISQNNLIGEGGNSNRGMIVGTIPTASGEPQGTVSATFINDLWIVEARNPNVTSATVRLYNGVAYDWEARNINLVGKGTVDEINRYYKPGPKTVTLGNDMFNQFQGLGNVSPTSTSIYTAGNFVPGYLTSPTADNRAALWSLFANGNSNPLPSGYFRSSPLAQTSATAYTLTTAQESYNRIVLDREIGHNRSTDSNGNAVVGLDSIDTHYVNAVQNGTNPQLLSGGFVHPSVPSTTPYTDSNFNGIADNFNIPNNSVYDDFEFFSAYIAGDLDRLADTEGTIPTLPPVNIPNLLSYNKNSNTLFLNS